MPEYSNNYMDQMGGMNTLGGSINNIALGLAHQKAMERRFQMQMAQRMAEQALKQRLYQQEGQNYEAQAALHRAQTALENTRNTDLTNAADARTKLSSYAEDIPLIKYQQDLGIDTEGDLPNAISGMMGQIARLPGSATTGYPEKMMQLLQTGNVPMEQAIATRTKSQIPVSSQGGIFNAATGAIDAMMPQQLSSQESLVNPYTGGEIGFNPHARTSVVDQRLKELATMGNIARAVMPGGDMPGRSSPAYPIATNTLSRIAELATQGINTPHGAPVGFEGPPNPAATPSAPKIPTIGEVRGGYKFIGGDPANPASWSKVQ